jgi:hypothetical protein
MKIIKVNTPFDNMDGEESFRYDCETKLFTVTLALYSSNMVFTIQLDDSTRMQFCEELNKFLSWSKRMLSYIPINIPQPHYYR